VDYSTKQLYCSDTQIVTRYLVPTSAKKGPPLQEATAKRRPTGKKQSQNRPSLLRAIHPPYLVLL
jgi:hypothetical protein